MLKLNLKSTVKAFSLFLCCTAFNLAIAGDVSVATPITAAARPEINFARFAAQGFSADQVATARQHWALVQERLAKASLAVIRCSGKLQHVGLFLQPIILELRMSDCTTAAGERIDMGVFDLSPAYNALDRAKKTHEVVVAEYNRIETILITSAGLRGIPAPFTQFCHWCEWFILLCDRLMIDLAQVKRLVEAASEHPVVRKLVAERLPDARIATALVDERLRLCSTEQNARYELQAEEARLRALLMGLRAGEAVPGLRL